MENKKTVKCTPSVMKKCAFSSRYNSNSWMCCDYIGKTGHSRGCPPDCCDKFKKRAKELK